ncbi:MAG: hypothetical protein FWG16_03705 [Micrococcales bacterium]|nr:hypothetical protein [Micrococcales bacterium]
MRQRVLVRLRSHRMALIITLAGLLVTLLVVLLSILPDYFLSKQLQETARSYQEEIIRTIDQKYGQTQVLCTAHVGGISTHVLERRKRAEAFVMATTDELADVPFQASLSGEPPGKYSDNFEDIRKAQLGLRSADLSEFGDLQVSYGERGDSTLTIHVALPMPQNETQQLSLAQAIYSMSRQYVGNSGLVDLSVTVFKDFSMLADHRTTWFLGQYSMYRYPYQCVDSFSYQQLIKEAGGGTVALPWGETWRGASLESILDAVQNPQFFPPSN